MKVNKSKITVDTNSFDGEENVEERFNLMEDTLTFMYEGDKNRDASSKIRGFLYQDYITIDFLLKDDVKYVYT